MIYGQLSTKLALVTNRNTLKLEMYKNHLRCERDRYGALVWKVKGVVKLGEYDSPAEAYAAHPDYVA